MRAFLALLLLGGLGFAIWSSIEEERRWTVFAAKNHCKVVGKTSGSSNIGFDSAGRTITTFTPGQTGYACDDGVTYWR